MRLKGATEEKELATFGFFVFEEQLELNMMEFKEAKYRYSVLKQLTLSTMYSTFWCMEESLEYLLGFFALIIKSTVVEKNPLNNPTLFEKYKEFFKPTITFI